jgi:hypothetical protein
MLTVAAAVVSSTGFNSHPSILQGRMQCQQLWMFPVSSLLVPTKQGERQSAACVSVTCKLSISELKQRMQTSPGSFLTLACQETAPLRGVTQKLLVQRGNDMQISARIGPAWFPGNIHSTYHWKLECSVQQTVLLPWQQQQPQQCRSFYRVQHGTSAERGLTHSRSYGVTRNIKSDLLGVGCMAKGWDAEAWAQQGLPESGELLITGTVSLQPFDTAPGKEL